MITENESKRTHDRNNMWIYPMETLKLLKKTATKALSSCFVHFCAFGKNEGFDVFHHVMIAKIDKEPKATSTQQSPPSSSSNSHLPYVADFPAPSYGRKRKRKENSNLFLN